MILLVYNWLLAICLTQQFLTLLMKPFLNLCVLYLRDTILSIKTAVFFA